MSGRFVRASKYRHIFGQTCKKELCYDNLKISNNAWDSNLISANPFYLSVNWNSGAGGAIAVIPLENRGKLPDQTNLFRGHTAAVLDTDWNPFHDQVLASGGDDAKIMLWKVPEDYTVLEPYEDVHPVAHLTGHSRKVGHVQFHPVAANVLASSSADKTIKLWDCEKGIAHVSLPMNEICQSISFNADGNLLVSTGRDKKIRVWDPRTDKPVSVTNGHAGAKNSRSVWLGSLNRIATTGFSKMSDRQLALWDPANMSEPIGGFTTLDAGSGILMPFWDDGTNVIYLAGKGDGNIRYYELENDVFHYLSEFKSVDPQRGIAFVPKRGVNVAENEVMRAYKSVNDTIIEPISFIVPRRSEAYQSDIYPPAPSGKPSLSADEWFSGKDALVDRIDMSLLYEAKGPVSKTTAVKIPTQEVQKDADKNPIEVKPSKKLEPAGATPVQEKAAEDIPSNKKEEKELPKEEKKEIEQKHVQKEKKPEEDKVLPEHAIKSEKKAPEQEEVPVPIKALETKKGEIKEDVNDKLIKREKELSMSRMPTISSPEQEGSLSQKLEAIEKRYNEEMPIRDWKIAQLEEKITKLSETIDKQFSR
ncbi:actin binding protein [Schizosaccharomyces cryophilus OY26]|uniref:Coronin n=1 Tax=Schizosaccharomyces cryophilus (strain OY26 / ATCC MYA-4695 / CBS 11777 / NBRC 106824 / NRRL Y48691) TaxID=653667 RepID=S9VXS3_SCHCR|nr:actin binding protein [Schizosaccharomyces cryophilus OY26]EPY50785.1 actin binding protein [Schizosaccharomyces cryophilus OY26]